MNKYDYLRKLITTTLKESIDEYKVFDGSFDDFQKRYPINYTTDRGQAQTGGRVYIYNIAPLDCLKSIFSSGPDRQFAGTGEKTDTYGRGFYGTLTYEGTFRNLGKKGKSYAKNQTPVVIKYVLKDGLKNFLVYDDNIRRNNGVKETPAQQLRKYFDPNFLSKYDYSIKTNKKSSLPQSDLDKGIDMLDLPSSYLMNNDWNSCRNLTDFIIPYDKRHDDFQDVPLKNAGIRGYVSSGETDNDVVIVKNFKDVIPIAYAINPRERDESQVDWKTDLTTEENFNRVNNSEDSIWRFGHKYDGMTSNDPVTFGIMRVCNKGKYNYVNLDNDEELLPFWADDASIINQITKKSEISVGGKKFMMSLMPNGNVMFRQLKTNNEGDEIPFGIPMNSQKLGNFLANG